MYAEPCQLAIFRTTLTLLMILSPTLQEQRRELSVKVRSKIFHDRLVQGHGHDTGKSEKHSLLRSTFPRGLVASHQATSG